MSYFSVVIPYVAWMLVYILLGFAAVKAGWSETAHARSISGILVYICAPAMFFRAFQRMTYSPEDFKRIGLFFVVTLAIQVVGFSTAARRDMYLWSRVMRYTPRVNTTRFMLSTYMVL